MRAHERHGDLTRLARRAGALLALVVAAVVPLALGAAVGGASCLPQSSGTDAAIPTNTNPQPQPTATTVPPNAEFSCAQYGGTCAFAGQGGNTCTGVAGDGLGCTVEPGDYPDVFCCLAEAPDACNLHGGTCTAKDTPCAGGSQAIGLGCAAASGPAPLTCCVQTSDCVTLGGLCVDNASSDVDCAANLGDTSYHLVVDNGSNDLCPTPGAPAPPSACCMRTLDPCGQHGGLCQPVGFEPCPNPTPSYACNRPSGPFTCCGAIGDGGAGDASDD